MKIRESTLMMPTIDAFLRKNKAKQIWTEMVALLQGIPEVGKIYARGDLNGLMVRKRRGYDSTSLRFSI